MFTWRETFFFALTLVLGSTLFPGSMFLTSYLLSNWLMLSPATSGLLGIILPILLGLSFLGLMAVREHLMEKRPKPHASANSQPWRQ